MRRCIIIASLAWTACTSAPPAVSCMPGSVDVCGCPGGGVGTQRCGDDGAHYLVCTNCPSVVDAAAPDVDAGTADAGPPCADYPCGPYGYAVGSTIENLRLIGQTDDDGDGRLDANDTVRPIFLSELRNHPGVRAIVIDVFAEWCVPCNMEQPQLVMLASTYAGRVAFFGVMEQDHNGNPATIRALDQWSAQYHVAYAMAADPDLALGPYTPEEAYPTSILVRTRDMQIVYVHSGDDPTDLAAHIDALLAAP
jgi:thiol-disulfide isomerase/thioredoxin